MSAGVSRRAEAFEGRVYFTAVLTQAPASLRTMSGMDSIPLIPNYIFLAFFFFSVVSFSTVCQCGPGYLKPTVLPLEPPEWEGHSVHPTPGSHSM